MNFLVGDYTSSQDKFSGGNVGIAAIAIACQYHCYHDKITEASIPTQELTCCGVTSKIITFLLLFRLLAGLRFHNFSMM